MPDFYIKDIFIGNFKAVIFDKDGTLSSSENYLKSIAELRIEEAIKKLGKQSISQNNFNLEKLLNDAYGLKPDGIDPNGSLAIASRHDNLVSTATVACLKGYSWPQALQISEEIFEKADIELETKYGKKNCALIKGVPETLDKLKNSGIKCSIMSNDSEKGIKNFLNANHLGNIFEHYWSCENIPQKPDPRAVKILCEKMSLNCSDCLFIGDSDTDMKMGKIAKIGINLGFMSGWKIQPKMTYQDKLLFNWEDLTCH